jgi:hypothetical protein
VAWCRDADVDWSAVGSKGTWSERRRRFQALCKRLPAASGLSFKQTLRSLVRLLKADAKEATAVKPNFLTSLRMQVAAADLDTVGDDDEDDNDDDGDSDGERR